MDLESQFGIRDSIFIIAIQRGRLVLSPSSISRLFHWFLTGRTYIVFESRVIQLNWRRLYCPTRIRFEKRFKIGTFRVL